MRRAAGSALAAAGLTGAVAVPAMGVPDAFGVLLPVALVLWFVGVGAAVGCLAPLRPLAVAGALGAAALAWPALLRYGLAPLWGALAAVCGAMVVVAPVRADRRSADHAPAGR